MNDLSTLKRAMDAPPGYTPSELDLAGIVRAGGRLRFRRRLAAGSVSTAAVLAVLIGGSQLIPGSQTEGGVRPANADQSGPIGTVIDTGLATTGGTWVLYGIRLNEKQLEGIPFGIMLGIRQADGRVTPSVEINETEGSALAPGFHVGELSQNLNGRDTLTFGYYVGRPHRIAAKVRGKQVSAGFKAWSEDPSVTVFWFNLTDAGPDTAVTGLTAYDSRGEKMVSGNPGFGVG
jgi:hypothetical protein